MIIDVRKLAEEAELKSPDGNYRYRAIDRRIEAFANLVLEEAAKTIDCSCKNICDPNACAGACERYRAMRIRGLKVKP